MIITQEGIDAGIHIFLLTGALIAFAGAVLVYLIKKTKKDKEGSL